MDFKKTLAKDYQKQITNYFMGDKEKAMKFMTSVAYSVQRTPALLECDKSTLLTAFMTCAEYRLYPSSASGEAYVLPYAGKAQFQLGYQGIITLLYRAGVDAVRSNIVYDKDRFEYQEGLKPVLIHSFDFAAERGQPKGVYAVAVVNGQEMFKVMSKTEVMRYKEFSKSKKSEYSPWNSGNDPELWMWKKTCIKQLAKILPKNDEIQRAMERENEDSTIERANLNADGPAVAGALHEPESKTETPPAPGE